MKQPAEYSSEDRKIAFEKTADFLKSSYSQWENTFGPFTELPSDMDTEERDKALGEIDEQLELLKTNLQTCSRNTWVP